MCWEVERARGVPQGPPWAAQTRGGAALARGLGGCCLLFSLLTRSSLQFGEHFEFDCKDCVCLEGGSGIVCQPRKCGHNTVTKCAEDGTYLVTEVDPTDTCCNVTSCSKAAPAGRARGPRGVAVHVHPVHSPHWPAREPLPWACGGLGLRECTPGCGCRRWICQGLASLPHPGPTGKAVGAPLPLPTLSRVQCQPVQGDTSCVPAGIRSAEQDDSREVLPLLLLR